MGLKLRYYLFHGVTSPDVSGALQAFYAGRGSPLIKVTEASDDTVDVHTANNNWVVVELDIGWEWKERREALLFVSERLWCPAFLVFVYDGEYWGYEFVARGKELDHFVQMGDQADRWFPNQDCSGNPQVLVQHLPFLDLPVIAPYLKQRFDYWYPPELKGKVHPDDEFERFNECSVLDFLRAIGVGVELQDSVGFYGVVEPTSPIDCSLLKEQH